MSSKISTLINNPVLRNKRLTAILFALDAATDIIDGANQAGIFLDEYVLPLPKSESCIQLQCDRRLPVSGR